MNFFMLYKCSNYLFVLCIFNMKYRVKSCLSAKFQLVTAMKYHKQWGISLGSLCTSYRFTHLHGRWMLGGVLLDSLSVVTKTWTASIYLPKEFLRTWF